MGDHMNRPEAIIVGGGIGGLSCGVGLSRKGVRVRLYEKSAKFGEVGAGLQLAPNCTRILDDYGLLAEAIELGVVPRHMRMLDALEGGELTNLDLGDAGKRYGFPYLVMHRSDLHGLLLREARRLGVELITSADCADYENVPNGVQIRFTDGRTDQAEVVIAADGLHSVARRLLADDEPVNSAYVAYRGAVPFEAVAENEIFTEDVVVYVGPRCHFVQYPLRDGEMFNQVAVFESAKARAGIEDWGTPDELDAAFASTCVPIQKGLPLMGRDRWWRMFDRDPTMTWVNGRIALLGDAAHPPLQYMAQGAVMAIEDGWVLAEHVGRPTARHTGHGSGANLDASSGINWDAALAAYEAVRPEHCRRVVETARAWGNLWHLDGQQRGQRNAILRARDIYDYSFLDWIFGPTALTPDQEPEPYQPIPLGSVEA